MTNQIFVENEAQAALFNDELSGQISDGFWENAAPHNHWVPWGNAVAVVAEKGQSLGRDFFAGKDNYNFLNGQLLEWQSEAMIQIVQDATNDDSYNYKQLRKDLTALKRIIRQRIVGHLGFEA